MDASLNDLINNGNLFLQENKIEEAIEQFSSALDYLESNDQKIKIHNLLGRLYQRRKNTKKAIDNFQISLNLYENSTENEFNPEKASILNNLAAIYLETDSKLAIQTFNKALKVYEKIEQTNENDYKPHLANTHFALAEASLREEDFYKAKNHFKSSIKLYEQISNDALAPFKANAFYQLGNIYTDEFNLFDAQKNYTKALEMYQDLSEKDISFYPYLAAVLNNLGVTHKSMNEHEKSLSYYQESLKTYQSLAKDNSPIFTPYLAATSNSLSILFADMADLNNAIKYSHQTVDIYNDLSDSKPEEYTHYLATALHNLGLFYFEIKDNQSAKNYFEQALSIRKKLGQIEPGAFDADVCTTSLNLVELYQSELESKIDLKYSKLAIELLSDMQPRLEKLDNERPVVKSMRSDHEYYLNYFKQINLEQLKIKFAFDKVDELTEEILSTGNLSEKITIQSEIIKVLKKLYKEFPNNEKVRNEFAYAYNDLSWIYLRSGKSKNAEESIKKAQLLEQPILPLDCNLAHCYLLQDKFELAKPIYLELVNKKDINNKLYRDIIIEDIEKLKIDGIDHADFEKLQALL